jgi:ABC-type lipoprotein release transport system permease subunit
VKGCVSLIGLATGTIAALASRGILQSSLYGVTPHDPRVFMSTAALLLVVAIAACLVPTWRATRADPMEVLRAD